MTEQKKYQLHLVSFYGVVEESTSFQSNEQLKQRQALLNYTATMYGDVDEVHSWDLNRLRETNFYEENKQLLDRSRGCGYWAWKPFIILETMRCIKDGDFVFYCDIGRPAKDAEFDYGNQITDSLLPLVEWSRRNNGMMPGVYLPHHGASSSWIKNDCYKVLGCEDEKYKKIPILQAGYSVWQKCAESVNFLQEWLAHCTDASLITDDPNVLGGDNSPGFIRHSHDQAILTLLSEKHSIKGFGDPKFQFWGFRNINFIAKKAAYENAIEKRSLNFSQLNSDYNVVPNFLTSWIELLFCERRQLVSRMLVMGQDDFQVDMWTRYFPKATVFSENDLSPVSRISTAPVTQKNIYDLIITTVMEKRFYTVKVFLRIYESLNEGGVAFIGPLPDSSDELERYARALANEDKFPDTATELPEHDPKIHNSKNPIFLQSGASRYILLYKPEKMLTSI